MDVHQEKDTWHYLLPQDDLYLLVNEAQAEEPVSEGSSSTAERTGLAGKEVTELSDESVPVPRVQRINTHVGDRYMLLKKYDGVVTARGEDSFVARLFENASDYPVVEAEFDLEELSETDRDLAVEGAALVWTIGYGYDGGTRKRESVIYLRRLPHWSDTEIEEGRQAAEDLTRGIEWE
jgi:hypothetical protein